MTRALVACCLVLCSLPLHAAEYGSDVAVGSVAELVGLAAAGEIDDEALDALLQLYDAPLDPGRADVDALALLPGVSRSEAARLSADAPLEAQAAAYTARAFVARQRVDSGGVYSAGDAPEAYLRLSAQPFGWLSAGASLLTRERTRIDVAGRLLTSDGPRREVGLERWHVVGTSDHVTVLLGNYTCDFGESVTFSTARRAYAPALAVSDAIVRSVDGATVRGAPALRGGAVRLEVGDSVRVAAQAFASYRDLDLYQYGEWSRDGEAPVIADGEVSTSTISGAARETLGGGALVVRYDDHAIGLVGYAASVRLTDPMGGFSPGSRYPDAPAFGAVGVHAMSAIAALRLRAEVATTLAGGLGGLVRAGLVGDTADLTLSGRLYTVAFDNPYTRGFAEADLYEGARARNERGVELVGNLAVGGLVRLAGAADVWTALTAPSVVNARARGRLSVALTDDETVSLEADRLDKDVRVGGAGASYTGESCAVTQDCARGARSTATARVVTTRLAHVRLMLAARRTLIETGLAVASEDRATAHVTVTPWRWLTAALVASERLSARVPELASSRRLLTGTISARVGEWLDVGVTARTQTRWIAGAERSSFGGAVDVTIKL